MADVLPCALVEAHVMQSVEDMLAAWVLAEMRGDVAALEALLGDDFRGDDAFGNVLTKDQWIDRHRSRELVNGEFAWHDTAVHLHNDTAVAMGILTQRATYRGEDCSGQVGATLVAAMRDAQWFFVNLQLSLRRGRGALGSTS